MKNCCRRFVACVEIIFIYFDIHTSFSFFQRDRDWLTEGERDTNVYTYLFAHLNLVSTIGTAKPG